MSVNNSTKYLASYIIIEKLLTCLLAETFNVFVSRNFYLVASKDIEEINVDLLLS